MERNGEWQLTPAAAALQGILACHFLTKPSVALAGTGAGIAIVLVLQIHSVAHNPSSTLPMQVRAEAAAASPAAAAATASSGPVLLWLKRDLRLDDHPGWHQALAAAGAAPVFCFDPERYAHLVLPRGGAEGEGRGLAPAAAAGSALC